MSDKHYQFNEIYEMSYPHELMGEVIEGIDLQILASDSIRIVDAWAKQGELTVKQQEIFEGCLEELKIVVPHLEGDSQKYFASILTVVEDLIQKNK